MAFYQKIRDLREDADKTQADVAKYLGTTAQYYGKYEKGERELPFSRAIQLAEYYNVSLDQLAGINRCNPKDKIDDDEKKLLEIWRCLTERNRGKLELFMSQLIDEQANGKK